VVLPVLAPGVPESQYGMTGNAGHGSDRRPLHDDLCGQRRGGWFPMYFIKRGYDPMPADAGHDHHRDVPARCPAGAAAWQHQLLDAGHPDRHRASAHQAWSANIFTTVSDMFPKKAVGSVTGIGGMFGVSRHRRQQMRWLAVRRLPSRRHCQHLGGRPRPKGSRLPEPDSRPEAGEQARHADRPHLVEFGTCPRR